VKRGTILHYLIGNQRLRVVVVTVDRYNPLHALVAPLRERAAPDLAPIFLVPLGQLDWPAPAVIDLSRVRQLDPSAITGAAGQLSEATLRALSLAVRGYLAPPD
jgi:hypothetical protein